MKGLSILLTNFIALALLSGFSVDAWRHRDHHHHRHHRRHPIIVTTTATSVMYHTDIQSFQTQIAYNLAQYFATQSSINPTSFLAALPTSIFASVPISFPSIIPTSNLSSYPISISIPSIVPTTRPYKQTYHNRNNLKLVYQSVLPPGMKRSDDNVIFEYTDNEAGKTCRCICRMN